MVDSPTFVKRYASYHHDIYNSGQHYWAIPTRKYPHYHHYIFSEDGCATKHLFIERYGILHRDSDIFPYGNYRHIHTYYPDFESMDEVYEFWENPLPRIALDYIAHGG